MTPPNPHADAFVALAVELSLLCAANYEPGPRQHPASCRVCGTFHRDAACDEHAVSRGRHELPLERSQGGES